MAEGDLKEQGKTDPTAPHMEGMAESIIEEYMMLGFSDQQILTLFKKSLFAGTNIIYKTKGDDYIKGLIQKARERWGIVPKFNIERAKKKDPTDKLIHIESVKKKDPTDK